MKVAIVHDWLYGGGAEQVVYELHKMFPEAPIYTSYCSEEWRNKLDNKVVTGYLQHPPFRQLRKFLPLLRQWWFSRLDLSDFDLVISSSGNGEAKSIVLSNKAKHISYSHSVNQFYWRHYDEYMAHPGQRPYWAMRLGLKLLLKPMRRYDYLAAQRVDNFIANSSFTKQDILTYYKRDSEVIFPPVKMPKKIYAQNSNRSGLVTMSRLVPWKRVEIIVDACTELSLPLTVIGDGPELEALKRSAGPTVTFVGGVFDDTKYSYIVQAEAFIMASVEPFGIAPIEAMAAGTPVIAFRGGGALDYVVPGKSGEFFDEQTPESLIEVLKNFDPKKYSTNQIRAHAEQFSEANFRQKLQRFIDDHTA